MIRIHSLLDSHPKVENVVEVGPREFCTLKSVYLLVNGMSATLSCEAARELAAALIVCAENAERDR